MFSIFLVLTLAIFPNAWCSNTAYNILGCPHSIFDDPNTYHVPLKIIKNDLAFGLETNVTPLVFESLQQIEQFTSHVNNVIKETFETTLYDDMDEIVELKNKFEEFKQLRRKNESFKKFYSKYNPGFSPQQRDNVGLIVKVLQKIPDSESYKNARLASYIAAVDLSADLGTYDTADAEGKLPGNFRSEDVVGIIKVELRMDIVENESKFGFVIIDMKNAVTPVGFVMLSTVNNESIGVKSRSFGTAVKYRLIGSKGMFIEAQHYITDYVGSDVIYVSRPLCSFMRAESQIALRSENPVRYVKKLRSNENGHHYAVAFVGAQLYDFLETASSVFRTFSIGYAKHGAQEPTIVKFNSMNDLNDPSKEEIKKAWDDVTAILRMNNDEKKEFEAKMRQVEDSINLIRTNLKTIGVFQQTVNRSGGSYISCLGCVP